MHSYVEVTLQTSLAFGGTLLIARILGKQQLAEMTFFEYINGITFGSIAGNLATDLDQNTGQHLVGLIIFGILTWVMTYISLKSRTGRRLLGGDPVIVIQDGKIMEESMRKTRMTMEELMQLLRERGIFNISEVQFAIFENNGEISTMKKPAYDPLTPKTLNQIEADPPPQVPMELVVDGKVIYENLNVLGKDMKWLLSQLKKYHGVNSIEEVFYVARESDGQLYVDLRRD
ncbi:DUF421 domain-containing protein [Mechercharimyces sp. CAU 1602]|uniref:DUF421 domain-containing protein n=1 Tax=Mechercharimyces sp. CAU 1602 TaxID=2973933 RepID=UPI0021628CE0|nr:DUF421 domain-containing protein [Mechercharimyces sp. CAU 1602]MCS1350165.1 DUF421 domain-containing protein [Mechercharimyces sp. CAU 1602]